MSVKFALFSGECSATLNPWSVSPSVLIDMKTDPLKDDNGYVPPTAGEIGRGIRVPTLSSQVTQDFGTFVSDGIIQINVVDGSISVQDVGKLQIAFDTVDSIYYFTDSLNCWKVKFKKPGGLKYWRNMRAKYFGKDIFSYSLILYVESKEI